MKKIIIIIILISISLCLNGLYAQQSKDDMPVMTKTFVKVGQKETFRVGDKISISRGPGIQKEYTYFEYIPGTGDKFTIELKSTESQLKEIYELKNEIKTLESKVSENKGLKNEQKIDNKPEQDISQNKKPSGDTNINDKTYPSLNEDVLLEENSDKLNEKIQKNTDEINIKTGKYKKNEFEIKNNEKRIDEINKFINQDPSLKLKYQQELDSLLKYNSNLLLENNNLLQNIESLKKDRMIFQLKISSQRNLLIFACAVILLLLLLGFIAYRGYLTKKKFNRELQILNQNLESANNDLKEKNDEISMQKNQIDYQHKNIMDSIGYAERIQKAVLPDNEKLLSIFKDSFVLYQPRDIVSGDFYWLSIVENKIFIALADCTGHGVPGGFMSMIGINLLNQIINTRKLLEPGLILEELNNLVRQSLHLEISNTGHHDGMEICIVRLDNYLNNVTDKKYKISISGAGLGVYFSENGLIKEIRVDRRGIGYRQKEEIRKFNTINLEIPKSEKLYFTSDGFYDLHDEADNKYGKKKFIGLIESLSGSDLKTQGIKIEKEMKEFSGKEKLRDDITVIGIKL
jgi:serine phosphatase RsbU (regulator of sigma subunit)